MIIFKNSYSVIIGGNKQFEGCAAPMFYLGK